VGVTTYPVPSPGGGPAGITAGPDGALWFTEGAGNRIGRITTAGAIMENPLPTAGARPFGITVGPDGALWFTESGAGQIGRITTAGAITEYPLPRGLGPARITTGPDGALWFTRDDSDELAGRIGRITTDGVVTGYLEQNDSGNFGGIAAGPDGALWFTERVAIGRITTAGVVTEYPYPELEYTLPGGIVAGPDGALWFTELYTNKIDRITIAGAISEYPLPTAIGAPAFITTGPDGALWFTEAGNPYQIGRITTAGAIAEYPLPASASGPYSIATGPDGALWFTSPGNNAIGRAALNVPAVTGGTPAAGSGVTQTFTFQFSHPAGYQNLGVVNVLINNSLDARNACYLAYVQPSSTLHLVDDAGDAGGPFAGQIALGGAGAIQNSQCAVNLVSAVGSGTTLMLTVNIAFQAGFAGNKIAFAAAADLAAASTGWQAEGVWQVPPAAPSGSILVTGVTPARGVGLAGELFELTFVDSKYLSDFGVANLLINGNYVDGRGACYLAYVQATNTLFLVDDAGDAGGPFAGGMVLNGKSATIQNSQCLVTSAGSSFFPPFDDTLALTLNITFKGAFDGNRVLYAAGRDAAGGSNTGWQAVGTWSVQ